MKGKKKKTLCANKSSDPLQIQEEKTLCLKENNTQDQKYILSNTYCFYSGMSPIMFVT